MGGYGCPLSLGCAVGNLPCWGPGSRIWWGDGYMPGPGPPFIPTGPLCGCGILMSLGGWWKNNLDVTDSICVHKCIIFLIYKYVKDTDISKLVDKMLQWIWSNDDTFLSESVLTCCWTMGGQGCLGCCWDNWEAMRICCWICCWCCCCWCCWRFWAYAACCMCCSRSCAKFICPGCLPGWLWPGEMGDPPTITSGGCTGGGGFSTTKLPAIMKFE